MIRKTSLILLGAAAGVAATLLVTQPRLILSAKAAAADTYRQLNLFGDVFERVKNDYVREVPDDKLVENAINGMLTSLDPHSSYLNPEAAKDMRVQTKGEFGGLGIEVTMENELVKVITPIDDTPAQLTGRRAAGRQAGQYAQAHAAQGAPQGFRHVASPPVRLGTEGGSRLGLRRSRDGLTKVR